MDAKERHKLQRRRERKNRARAMNSLDGPTGKGGCGDRSQGGTQKPARNFNELQREITRWYYNSWAARKGIDIPPSDMLREAWTYSGMTDEQQKKIDTTQDGLGLVKRLKQALRLERLLGGSVILMGVADHQDDASQPIDLSAVGEGDLKFLNVIPRNRISRGSISNNPLAEGFGEPETYIVNGVSIHRSRLLIFDGDPVAPDNLLDTGMGAAGTRRRNDGFGDSVLEGVLDDLTYATGTRQAAYHLVEQASVWILETDMLSLGETKQGDARINELENIAQQVSMYKAALLDNGGDSRAGSAISSVSPSFGSVPELMMSFLQVLSGAFDIPATRYMSQSPGGLNATGDSDLENYYNQLEAAQRQNLRPQLMKLLQIMIPSTFGPGVIDIVDVDVEFEPLWNLSEVEQSTVRTNDTNNIVALATSGTISSTEAEAEARERGILITQPPAIEGAAEFTDADLDAQLDRILAQ